MDAEGCIGVCWRDEPYIDNAVQDFRECLLKTSRVGARLQADTLGTQKSFTLGKSLGWACRRDLWKVFTWPSL